MPSGSNTHERPRIEAKVDVTNKCTLTAAESLRLHWPEYLMEAGESGIYLFSACAVATLLWHPASPLQKYLPSDTARRMFMGLAMGATALVRYEHESGPDVRPRILGKLLARPLDLFRRATPGHACGG